MFCALVGYILCIGRLCSVHWWAIFFAFVSHVLCIGMLCSVHW